MRKVSPVPAQIWLKSYGSIAKAETEDTSWSSKMGRQRTPPSSVLKSPPEAPPEYMTNGLPGSAWADPSIREPRNQHRFDLLRLGLGRLERCERERGAYKADGRCEVAAGERHVSTPWLPGFRTIHLKRNDIRVPLVVSQQVLHEVLSP